MSFQTKQSLMLVITRFGMILLAMCATVVLLALVVSRALPGGGAIGFHSSHGASTNIFVLDIARGTLHNVTDNDAVNTGFAFSPDGTRIAFSSNKGGNTEIYMMNVECPGLLAACGGIVQLTDGETDSGNPVWSPDGQRIAYVHDVSWNDPDNEIYVVDVESGERWNVTNHPADDYSPVWSPDGSRIAFISYRDALSEDYRNSEIYAVNRDGSGLQRLTMIYRGSFRPAWSLDGDELIFESMSENDITIFIMSDEGRHIRPLIGSRKFEVDPAWSPNGREVAFRSDMYDVSDVCIMEITTDEVRCITSSFDETADRFAWSPNGDRIVFESQSRLFVTDVSGTRLYQLIADYGYAPIWWPERTP